MGVTTASMLLVGALVVLGALAAGFVIFMRWLARKCITFHDK